MRALTSGFDLSRLAYLKVDEGKVRGGESVYGVCRSPDKRRKTREARTMYRISCFVRGPFPANITTRKRPLYRREDGTFPSVPDGLTVSGSTTFGPPPKRAWLSLRGETVLSDLPEAVAWICAHELYHYLRATRQVPGRNAEIEADAYADARLEDFRRDYRRGRAEGAAGGTPSAPLDRLSDGAGSVGG